MSKKLLKITVGVISAFPVLLGINGMVHGTNAALEQLLHHESVLLASLDGSLRYLSSLLLMFGFLFYWLLPRFDQYGNLFRILLIFLFVGGLARLVSVFFYGLPGALQQVVLAIELTVPLIMIPWHIAIYGFKLTTK